MEYHTVKLDIVEMQLSDESSVHNIVINMPSVGRIEINCLSQKDAEDFCEKFVTLLEEHTIETVYDVNEEG